MDTERKNDKLTPDEVKKKVAELIQRRRDIRVEREMTFYEPGYNPELQVTREFEKLSEQTGVSVAALEFLDHPYGIGGTLNAYGYGRVGLTRVENAFEDLNVGYALELRAAGLI